MSFEKFRILYALGNYIKQLSSLNINVKEFINENPEIASQMLSFFEAKFSPNRQKIPTLSIEGVTQNYKLFAEVLMNLISQSIVRTNYFLQKSYISFKIDLSLFDKTLISIPKPITFKEIFVFSEEFEAIHLRLGKIARGGLRWSDRADDYRTEVLGLVKTQNTKNTIIVPVGSKGGFFIKKQPEGLSKEEAFEFGRQCYRKFISGLLDITDNVIKGEVITPEGIIIYDEKDPYLAVAADKGTASFSDIANELSKEYKFWLGDAFASGGSNGYDHKKMAITSRGAWVSTQRHFREIEIDVSKKEFTVVAIGDMSGDVFGNGMLRSDKIKLICAFNHLHIFIDPNPNAEASFKERERLFNLPTSTWEDYNLMVASQGARIFKRSDAICSLTPEIKVLFNIKADEITPTDLIRIVLKSKFDLLWNGGIGTYVKASFETNEQVGDKINDPLRINGNELGAKVVTEGGNLGFTQYGRVEYELAGGKINTDAIDNSAGVDCSDHEVNIKILLNQIVASGSMNANQRNSIIKNMTEDVAELVLEDNYNQTQAISLEKLKTNIAEIYPEFVKELEVKAGLDRLNEKLPNDEDVIKRGLTRPELSILLAYSKMESYNILLESDLINDEFTRHYLVNYFPKEMQQKLLPEILSHKLRAEIISTVMSNRFVNFGGIFLGFEVKKATGRSLIDVIKAYFIIEKVLKLEDIFIDIKDSDYIVSAEKQYQILQTIRESILTPSMIKFLNQNQNIQNINTEIIDIETEMKDVEVKNGL